MAGHFVILSDMNYFRSCQLKDSKVPFKSSSFITTKYGHDVKTVVYREFKNTKSKTKDLDKYFGDSRLQKGQPLSFGLERKYASCIGTFDPR